MSKPPGAKAAPGAPRPVFSSIPGGYTFHLTAEGYEATEFQPGNRINSDQKLTIYMKAVQPNSPQPSINSAVSAHELSMPRGAREVYASGMKKLYGDKNGQGGLGDFQKALQKAPSFYEAQFQMGMAPAGRITFERCPVLVGPGLIRRQQLRVGFPRGMFRYICISVAGLLTGVIVGSVGGLSLGWLLALGHHRRGPSDPGDAPGYVAIGLTMSGACLGAIVGLLLGIVASVRLARRKAIHQVR